VAVSGGQVLSRADQAGAAQLEEHLRYLLGQGPRPAATTGPAAGGGPQESSREGSPAGGKPLPVTDSSFDQAVLHSPLPVVVDFWAPWCGPCRMVEPTVEKLSREYNGKARFYKMNVDENPRVSARYGIQSIPTMMVVRNGQIVDRWSGAYPEQALRGRVEPLLRG
ncbi:MAG TPA: thioredoxin, partial [Anaerolineaceae bacterium]